MRLQKVVDVGSESRKSGDNISLEEMSVVAALSIQGLIEAFHGGDTVLDRLNRDSPGETCFEGIDSRL